jgi:S-adenosylmethionine synthetase
MRNDFIFTSESVLEGHPDKLCDQISDAIVDHILRQDPFSRVIAECAASTAIVFVAARFATKASVDFSDIARKTISQIGYEQNAFNSKTCSIISSLRELPAEEYCCLDERKMSEGEIDQILVKNQATVFGFACNQTAVLMPLPIYLAHKLSRQVSDVRHQKKLPYLAPDGKTQVAVEYRERKPARIHSLTVIVSQNQPPQQGGPSLKKLQEDIRELVLAPAFRGEDICPDEKTQIFINPDGPFVAGGPSVHAGLTGRKGGVDTYGEYARQSGAALSGKDPSRIDRVGAYAARHAAKNIVAARLAEACEVQLSYCIGRPGPVSTQVETFGSGKMPDEELARLLERHFDFRLGGIIRKFNLRYLPSMTRGGFYRRLAIHGHMGRTDVPLPWEEFNKVSVLLGET